jgi:hypothetical protein
VLTSFRLPFLALAALWLMATAGGLAFLAIYESKPAPKAESPQSWPRASSLPRAAGYTLVMALHPQCPCSEATMDELGLLMARCPNLSANLLFFEPQPFSDSWVERANLWKRAQAIPHVRCFIDKDGKEAALFGEQTSGQAALYGPEGSMRFQGGITAARGHAGDNIGLDSIVALTSNQRPPTRRTAVFGCSLTESAPGARL